MGAAFSVHAKDCLSLSLTQDGRVAGLVSKGAGLCSGAGGGFSISEAMPPCGEMRNPGDLTGSVSQSNEGLHFEGVVAGGGLKLRADFTGGDYIDVRGEVEDLTGKDRALYVTFLLPVGLTGWRWENTLRRAARMEPGVSYPSTPGDLLYLGKKDDLFSNEDPAVYPIAINKLPLSAVTGNGTGLSLAYPLHEPRVFLIKACESGYSITFSLGVSAVTEKFPGRASFRFVLYGVDPQWGLRSGLERYYSFFPELFAGSVSNHGNFGFFFLDMLADRPEEFGFAYMENDFQWKNGEMNVEQAAAARRLGIQVVHWRNPWVFHTPLDLPIPADTAPEAFLNRIKEWAAGEGIAADRKSHAQNCGAPLREAARCALNSHMQDESGRFLRGVYEKSHPPYWVPPMNMDPDLPRPNRYSLATDWQYRFIKEWSRPGFRGPRGFAWDATDDFDGFRRLNFRRDHFKTVSMPLTFDPETGGLCQVAGFHDWEFASRFTPQVRAQGGFIMANTTIEHSMMFLGHCIDVFVRERRIADNDEERLSVMRSLAGRKPVSFIGHWQSRDEAGLKAEVLKAFLFGIAAGAAGCSPKDPKGEAAERAVFKTRMPVLAAMAGAGWEPVTYARGQGVDVERYGSKPGALYFAVRNPADVPVKGRVVIDARPLGSEANWNGGVSEILEGREVSTGEDSGALEVRLDVNAGETLVLSVTPR